MEWIIGLIVTVVVGFGGIWIGHVLSSRHAEQSQFRQEKWQELNHWRSVYNTQIVEVQKLARPAHGIGYVFSDDEKKLAPYTPTEQYHIREARQARQRVEALAKELGIDAGISKDNLRFDQQVIDWN